MKTIIAGGRDYHLTKEDCEFLDTLEITEVVSGKAPGADTDGETYAHYIHVPVKPFPADWKNLHAPGAIIKVRNGRPYNAKAGFDRNEKMGNYAQQCVVFPGGNGTNSMYNIAKHKGLIVHDRRKV